MIRLIRWLISGDGHIHKYVERERFEIVSGPYDKTKGVVYVSACSVCGKMKTYKSMV